MVKHGPGTKLEASLHKTAVLLRYINHMKIFCSILAVDMFCMCFKGVQKESMVKIVLKTVATVKQTPSVMQ